MGEMDDSGLNFKNTNPRKIENPKQMSADNNQKRPAANKIPLNLPNETKFENPHDFFDH